MTISEIAKLAGVSPAAVSRFLNNGYISDDKKERIRKVIEETGYQPSLQAQTLRTRKTKMIGVIIPKIDSEAISRVVSGISYTLAENGYELLLGNTNNDVDRELNFLNIFKNNRVDGIIFIATILTPAHKALIHDLTIPIIILGQKTDYASCIYHDDLGAAKALTQLMIEKGRHKIAYIGVNPKDEAAGASRYEGYKSALQEGGIQFDARLISIGFFAMEAGYDCAKELLDRSHGIDAIFCATDMIAVGAMKYIREAGLRVPEDIAVTGVGHTRISRLMTPNLTTAHYYYKTSGMEAAALLLEALKEPEAPQKKIMLGYEIIEGASV